METDLWREDIAIAVTRGGGPDPIEVRDLYAAPSAGPPLNEPASVADGFAGLYAHLLPSPMTIVVAATNGATLVGLAYVPLALADQRDPWSADLCERLGGAAETLEGTLAVYLLAVHSCHVCRGLGTRLLRELLAAAHLPRAWLVTTDSDTPALRLYRRPQWQPIGHGPRAPDGNPSLVLVSPELPARL